MSRLRVFVFICLAGLLLCCAIAGAWYLFVPRPPLLDGVSFSVRVEDRHGDLMRLSLSSDEKYRIFMPLEALRPELTEATLLYEDRYFYQHWGVNPLALWRAFLTTYITKERRMGASTITMQLARLRYDLDTSSILGKLAQMERAFALERHYTKKDILEAYMNLAPYGGNVEGAGAAALVYYRKAPDKLSLAECLSLVVVPQNPGQRNPLSMAKKNRAALAEARARISSLWLEAHPEHRQDSFFHNVPLAVYGPASLPFIAPHVNAEAVSLGCVATAGVVRTTIDPRKQAIVEQSLLRFVQQGRVRGIMNGSAVLLHWPSMEIQALAGSANFFDNAIHGQVDGTRARRSPGSTLKPFVYALALDQGLIHPMTLLYDAPRSFTGYEPENSDLRFQGPISAQAALVWSRNIPAVSLANRLRQPDLYTVLQSAGASLAHTREEYGLSLVLGGGEVSPRVLAGLYASLANKGEWRESVLFRDIAQNGIVQKPVSGKHLFSPEAAAITLDMLRDNPSVQRVGFIGHDAAKLPKYWKTGTSNGFRDAWTAGIVGPYVLVIWIGNFDGTGNKSFIGAKSAAHLFLNIADALAHAEDMSDTVLAHMSGLNLQRVPVCSATGDTDTRLCPETVDTWLIPGVSPVADSGIYRRILIDTATGLRACEEDPERTEWKVWEFWPSDLMEVFAQAGVRKKPPPEFMPSCREDSMAGSGGSPVIVTPLEGRVYQQSLAGSAAEGGRGLALLSRAGAEVTSVFWFADGAFIGRSQPGKPLYWDAPGGTSIIQVMDEFGRSASKKIRVERLP